MTLTATVSSADGAPPGSVVFDGSQSLGMASVTGNAAVLATAALGVGSYGSFAPSSSPAVALAVSRAQTTTTGQVQFFEGKKKLGAAALVNGVASVQIAFAGMGQHVVTATYGGDATR